MSTILSDSKIQLFFWDKDNFGDRLSPYVIEKITGVTPTFADERAKSKFVAIGSLINKHTILSDSIFWGTGFLSEEFSNFGQKFKMFPLRDSLGYLKIHLNPNGRNFKALRGTLSRDTLERMGFKAETLPKAFADPALLMPYLYQPQSSNQQRYELGLICHFSQPNEDLERLIAEKFSQKVRFISMHRHTPAQLEECINEICSCDKIASTSLHGIIIAQAYGVPALFLQDLNHAVHRHCTFKFNDFFLGTQQHPQEPLQFADYAELIPQLLQMSFPKPPNFRQFCQNLLDVFPFPELLKLKELPY